MNKNGLYAFYGSLRMQMENHEVYKDGLVYLGTSTLHGFKMFLGEYPYLVRWPGTDTEITVELFRIDNCETEQNIHRLELGAGYIFDEVEIAKEKFGIYLFAEHRAGDPEITGGDWVQYWRNLGF